MGAKKRRTFVFLENGRAKNGEKYNKTTMKEQKSRSLLTNARLCDRISVEK
jgi:hypothetical protein